MTDSTDNALKPCPFCGGKPYLANVAMVGCSYVVCTDCRMQSDDGGRDRVVAAWNTRADIAPDPLNDPRVKALVAAADAVTNEREVVTQDFGKQLALSNAVDVALIEYRAAREAITKGTPPAFATSA